MVDVPLVLRKLAQLDEYLAQISEFSGATLDQYSGDWKTQRIVERTLQMMIELCIDIGGHIISDRKLRAPTSYADVFQVLFESGLMDENLAQIMKKMAKFRNVVIHHYDKIDEAIVINILQRHLHDFRLYQRAILDLLPPQYDPAR